MKLDDYFTLRLFKMHRAINVAINRRLAHLGITNTQIFILQCLSSGLNTKSQIAEELECDRTTITRLIHYIAKKNWVEEAYCAIDRRKKIVSLSSAGKRKLESSLRHLVDCDNTISFLWNKANVKAVELMMKKDAHVPHKTIGPSTQLLHTIRFFCDELEKHKW